MNDQKSGAARRLNRQKIKIERYNHTPIHGLLQFVYRGIFLTVSSQNYHICVKLKHGYFIFVTLK